MIIETNLTDLSKVTLENPSSWNEKIKFEVPRQWGVRNKLKSKRKPKTKEERKKSLREYNHKYYMEVTKIKRKKRRVESNVKKM